MVYILAKHNFWQLVGKREIVYKEAPDYIVDYLSCHGSYLIQSDTRPTNAVLIKGTGFDFPTKEEIRQHILNQANVQYEEADVIHYIKDRLPIKYRRNHMNEYLNKHFKTRTVIAGEPINCKANYCIISNPSGCEWVLENCRIYNIPVFYDRTDYWEADDRYKGMEDWLLNNAKVITCSSKYLAEVTPNGIRIDNGADVIKLKKVDKEPIAVYVGKEDKKIDLDVCKKWKEEHPELRFVSIGREIEGFEYIPLMPHDKMMRFLAKCKVGLIPLKQTEYCKGQFNLKYWDYKQAGLDVWTTIDYNYDNAVMKDWSTVCAEIVEAYGMAEYNNLIQVYDVDKVTVFKWRTSLACNYKCPYCIQKNAKEEHITREEADKVAKQIANLIDIYYTKHPDKELKFGLIGGEPSLYPLDKYVKLWNEACKKHNKHMPITIMTNFSLHDAEWWDNLTQSNISILLNASLHTSQVKSIDEFFDKAKSLTKTRIFIKFVATSDNLAEIKPLVERAKSLGLKVTIDAERTPNTQDVIANQEAVQFANDNSFRFIKLNNRPVSRNELIEECHKSGIKDCECYHRLYIAGNKLISGCKFNEFHDETVYDLQDLFWVKSQCSLFNHCSYCNAGKIQM